MAAVAQPVVGDVKWRRFSAALLDRSDSEMRQLIKDVDKCFDKGGYMINNISDYRTEEAFALGEELCLRRLREFLHLVGDIKVPIAWLIIKNKDPEDITMDDCLDTDVLFAVKRTRRYGLHQREALRPHHQTCFVLCAQRECKDSSQSSAVVKDSRFLEVTPAHGRLHWSSKMRPT